MWFFRWWWSEQPKWVKISIIFVFATNLLALGVTLVVGLGNILSVWLSQ